MQEKATREKKYCIVKLLEKNHGLITLKRSLLDFEYRRVAEKLWITNWKEPFNIQQKFLLSNYYMLGNELDTQHWLDHLPAPQILQRRE